MAVYEKGETLADGHRQEGFLFISQVIYYVNEAVAERVSLFE